jgi:hypothetical protein
MEEEEEEKEEKEETEEEIGYYTGHIVFTYLHRWQRCVRNYAICRLKVQPNLIFCFIITGIDRSQKGREEARKE